MVRMGRTPKGWAQTAESQKSRSKPKYSSSTLQPGRITTNVIASIYGPILMEKAIQVSEQYAAALLDWEEEVESSHSHDNGNSSVTTTMTTIRPRPKVPQLFATQKSVDNLSELIRSASRSMSGSGSWRARVNAAKFERQLDEKYGFLRPLLTHPTVEMWVKWAQRKHALGHFSLIRTTPSPLSAHNSLILLFMLQRNKVRTDALILTALFLLVGLQPWVLVCLVTYAVYWKDRRLKEAPRNAKLRSLKYRKPVPPYYANETKYQLLNQPVGSPLGSTNATAQSLCSSYYDAMILGTGVDTLYCAALLSRMGYRTLCLCPTEDASGCLIAQTNDEWKDIPFDVNDSKVAHTQAIQKLLAPALCTTTDAQGGVRFASIGTEADGYTYDIISVPGLGYGGSTAASFDDSGNIHSDDGNTTNKNIVANGVPFVLRAGGIASLAEDSAIELGDGWFEDGKVDQSTSSIAQYVNMCTELNTDANEYYHSKMLFNEQQAAWASILSGGKWSSTAYGAAAVRYAGDFLKRFIPYHPQVRSLAAAVGCRNEDILPSQTSMAAHVSNIAAASDPSGYSYPVGGPRSLGHALKHMIESLGGKVVTEVSVQEFVLEDEVAVSNTKQQKATPPRCVGVKLADGTILQLKKIKDDEAESMTNNVVISFLGAIPTCIRIPATVRDTHGIPTGIPALKERRPLVHLLCGLNGSSLDLDLPASDWWRLPSCSLPKDSVDANTGQLNPGNVGENPSGEDVASKEQKVAKEGQHNSEGDQQEAESTSSTFSLDTTNRTAKTKIVKFQTGKSWIRISFPSAKDPSWHDRYPKKSTCIITVEADDEFCRMIPGKPSFAMFGKPSCGEIQRLKDRMMKDLLDKFPQLEGKVAFQVLRGPFNSGLSQNPEKFAAKGVRPETQYPGLFLGGKDLTVDNFNGSLIGAWMSANAIMGYTTVDTVLLEKNITADLSRLLSFSNANRSEDVAVPLCAPLPAKENAEEQSVDSTADKTETCISLDSL